MFFCEPCRKANNWPESIARSRGACEICHNVRLCHDVPSSDLPDAADDETKTQLERIEILVGRLHALDEDLLRRIDHLLDEAQNRPPHGKWDGSIDSDKFNRLRTMVFAGKKFLTAYHRATKD